MIGEEGQRADRLPRLMHRDLVGARRPDLQNENPPAAVRRREPSATRRPDAKRSGSGRARPADLSLLPVRADDGQPAPLRQPRADGGDVAAIGRGEVIVDDPGIAYRFACRGFRAFAEQPLTARIAGGFEPEGQAPVPALRHQRRSPGEKRAHRRLLPVHDAETVPCLHLFSGGDIGRTWQEIREVPHQRLAPHPGPFKRFYRPVDAGEPPVD